MSRGTLDLRAAVIGRCEYMKSIDSAFQPSQASKSKGKFVDTWNCLP